jgi:uncharacterized protein YdhG (YjbR/CyaY superfamily)
MAAKAKPTRATASAKAFSDEELGAIRDRVEEEKAAARRGGKADGEADLLAAIAKMSAADRELATKVHAMVTAAAPQLKPKTWYGMPAWARGDKVVCHLQPAGKFKTRYATFGFSDIAHLDDGNMWPNAFALAKLTSADEARLAALVKQAAG